MKLLGSLLALALASSAAAQDRRVQIHFTPTARAQIAIWIESADGTRFRTIALTERTAYFGIGNRPGALLMNTSFRWPYGRREGVLPVWAHRRYRATGVAFPRVIFHGRASEGHASVSGSEPPNTRDPDYCLSFTAGDESLDAMSCATVFNSNKGRYITEEDVARGYAEPWESPPGSMRPLSLTSLYPPRQDLGACETCAGFPDAARFVSDARAVMPELDAVTMATPAGDVPAFIEFAVDPSWPDGDYAVYLEINREADFAPGWDPETHPGTPSTGDGVRWDYWAATTGFPGRGQPAIVFRVPIRLDAAGGEWSVDAPIGYAQLDGLDGEIRPLDGTIRDEPAAYPGSGADRLRHDPAHGGARLRVVVPTTDVCAMPDPPPDCGRECDAVRACPAPLVCGPDFTCVDRCEVDAAPGMPGGLEAEPWPDRRESHRWARARFVVPESARGVRRYEVRVSTRPIDPADPATFLAGRPAKRATEEDEALVVPVGDPPGTVIELEIGHLAMQTRHWIGLRAFDECGVPGPIAVAEVETTAIRFTTVSPCFVATAAYGSPLDPRLGALRRLRDRHLRASAVGRVLVEAYERVGAPAARWIAQDEDRRAFARALLAPIVALAELLAEI